MLSRAKLSLGGRTVITQRQLEQIIHLREQAARAKRAWEAEAFALATLEGRVMDEIDAGSEHEAGPLRAGINEAPGARRPSWKAEFVARCGEAAAVSVVESTAPTTVRSLVVMNTSKGERAA
jgi:hypothetical protein